MNDKEKEKEHTRTMRNQLRDGFHQLATLEEVKKGMPPNTSGDEIVSWYYILQWQRVEEAYEHLKDIDKPKEDKNDNQG